MGCVWRSPKDQGDSQSVVPEEGVGPFKAHGESSVRAPPLRASKGSEEKIYTLEQQAAAGKIGAALRGSATRWLVKEDYHEVRRDFHAVEPSEVGFQAYAQENASMPTVPDDLRFKVRDSTKRRVVEQLGEASFDTFEYRAARLLREVANSKAKLPPGPAKQMTFVHLFNQEEKPQVNPVVAAEGFVMRRQDKYLLGKFQIAAVPVMADYDAAFKRIENRKEAPSECIGPEGFNGWFWVLHSAAPNIGESSQAEDFLSYSVSEVDNSEPKRTESTRSSVSTSSRCCWKDRPFRPTRRLNEDCYISDIARLWKNALRAMQYLEVEDAILFPFGMGAFLRHLNLNDDQYEDPLRMRSLKRRIADELMTAIVDVCLSQPLKLRRVHLCLVCVNPESVDNHNSFVEAAAAKAKVCPRLKEVLQLRRNVDSLQLAHELGASGPLKVALLNGANRKLCGNHWFQGGARYAIDENLHRRSASLSRASLLLNFDTEPRPRSPAQLEETIRFFSGTVVDLDNLEAIPLRSEKEPNMGSVTKAKAKSSCLCCTSAKR